MIGAAAARRRETALIRPATAGDLIRLERFIAAYTPDGTLLARTRADLSRHLADFLVAAHRGALVGCGALQRVEPALGEIRTVAVDPEWRGLGVGGMLVEGLAQEARLRGMSRVFCLTRRVEFFRRHGFEVVEKDRFPQKVWNDCRHCPRLAWCDETAMERALTA